MRTLAASRFTRLLLVCIITGTLSLVSPLAAGAAPPEGDGKNPGSGEAAPVQAGETSAWLEANPTGKNAPDGPQAAGPAIPGGAPPTLPPPGSKNAGGEPASLFSGDEIAAPAGAGGLLTCGQQANLDWITTSGDFQVIHTCTLQVPSQGSVFVSATGSLARMDGPYEGQFRIGIDSTAGDANIDRWVNIYDDTGDGSDETVALSVLKPVGPGNHTFYFLGRRYGGTGSLLLYDPTLAVFFVPGASSPVRVCGVSGNANWTTTSGSYQAMRQCSLNLPRPGRIFVAANGSVARQDGPYEANFRIGFDNLGGEVDTDRWVDVWTDNGDGTDRAFALSALREVTAGSHTVYALGRRHSGSATVLVYDPTLTVLYFPQGSPAAKTCGTSGNLTWNTTSTGSYEVVRECQMTVPQEGWVYFSADASLGRQDAPYEARFRISIDNKLGDPNIDRWVNVYNDTGDGTDKSVALTVRRPIKAGTHTFYFLAQRHSGTGVVQVYDPMLTVIAPGARIYLPPVRKAY